MTDHSTRTGQSHQKSGWLRVARALTLPGLLCLSIYLTDIRRAAAQDAPALTETSLMPQGSTEVSDRESRLRDIEDELLKQLSVGATPSPVDSPKATMPDIQHVANPVPAVQPTIEPKPQQPTPPPSRTSAPRRANVVPVKLAEPSTTDIVSVPQARNPQRTSVVPVTAKSVPHRTPKIKRAAPEANLSAKDLEHRLAIAETQITLLTKELDTTKTKLAQSEARALDLTRQVEEGPKAVSSETKEEPTVKVREVAAAGADETDGVDTQAESYASVARITKDNTPLRLGPSSRESTIVRVSRGATVTIEHRTGAWYRVVTSDGTRGWVIGGALVFDEGVLPGSTVRVGAFQPQLEMMDLNF